MDFTIPPLLPWQVRKPSSDEIDGTVPTDDLELTVEEGEYVVTAVFGSKPGPTMWEWGDGSPVEQTQSNTTTHLYTADDDFTVVASNGRKVGEATVTVPGEPEEPPPLAAAQPRRTRKRNTD